MRYENARKLLDNYIIALHEHNCMGIRALVPGDYEAQADIDDRLEKFGGVRIDTTKIDISSDINPDILSAYINSSSDGGQVVKWTENLVWRDGQWWLVLGSLRPGDLRSRINR